LRYAALRRLGVKSDIADREAQSASRFTKMITDMGLDMAPYADIVKREPQSMPVSSDPKKVRARERRRHLRALGVDPERATWYSQRGRMYDQLVKQIESGSELTDAGPNP
jgi:hypothetical protein